jgi:cell division protein FtsB
MLQFYQKRSLRGWLHTPVALGILGIIILFMMSVVYQRYSIEQEMVERREEAEAHLKELESRRADLEKKVEYLSNERGIEAEMRRNFDVARPGEQVVIILDDEKKPEIEPLPQTTEDEPRYKFCRICYTCTN